jgi:thioredoxin-related protein
MIKKQFLPFLFAILSVSGMAQTPGGMNFIKAGSWEEVKAKAKAENKYIFLDGYTTWCGPCIMMAKKIFPLPEVGEFFNANFINVKVQLDTTANDNEHVKQWYKDGNFLMTKYGIRAFPTYLFFSPDGEIVHRAVGSSDAQTFIAKGKDALDPDKQYYTLSREYEKGNRDPGFLIKMAYAAKAGYDQENLKKYAAAYLATQQDMLNEQNVKFITDFTQSSADPGFSVMMNNQEKFDEVKKEPGFTANLLRNIILKEEVLPVLLKGREMKPSNPEPDWVKIKANLDGKYPIMAEQTLLNAKIVYYQRMENFSQFSAAITQMVTKYPNGLQPGMLNAFAWAVFENCDDIACIKQAVNWSLASVDKTNDPMYMDTYANLLHKSGNTADAIKWQKKAIEKLKQEGEDTDDFEETLAKMEKGEKTW